MRRQISALIPRKANICIFCASRSPGIATGKLGRSTRRAYHPSSRRCARSNTATATRQYDDDDEDGFAMLKNSAAKNAAPLKTKSTQPVKVDLPPSFTITRHAAPDRPAPDRSARDPSTSMTTQDEQRFSFRRNNYRDRDVFSQSHREPRDRDQRNRSSNFGQRSQDRGDPDVSVQSNQAQPGFTGIRYGGLNRSNRDAPGDPSQEQAVSAGFRFSRDSTGPRTGYNTRPAARPSQGPSNVRIWRPGQKQEPVETVETYKPQYSFQPLSKPAEQGDAHKSVAAEQRMAQTPARSQTVVEPLPTITKQSAAKESVESKSLAEVPIELPSTRTPFSKFSDRFAPDEEEQNQQDYQRHKVSRSKTAEFDFELYEAEQALSGRRGKKGKAKKSKQVDVKPVVNIPEFMTVQQLAQALKVKQDDLIQKLEDEGFEGARYDHMLDAETSAMFADIYGFEPVALEEEMKDLVSRPPPEDTSVLPERPPIVTIMGHVDHGKTTILDWLRKSSVAAGEHGGITQHIGAFSVVMPGTEKRITFLDTPGHEAFLDMRRRGANVTDIVVLVVAADDSVKPQTIEAIKHAMEARVQIIVAINKVDKHDANIEQVKQDLTRHEIVVEDYGGDYQAIPVSGKTGQGMEQLEEAIITLADVLDLRAEQDIPAEGQIIESKVTNAGRIATILVRRGVLRVGDFIVAGPTWGRVRTLRNDAGQLVQAAYPGDPVQVDGWRGADPTAGLEVLQADNEQQAKDVVEMRLEKIRVAQSLNEVAGLNAAKAQEAEARAKVLAWERENAINARRRRDNEGWVDAEDNSAVKEVFFVVKADVAGSVEAIVAAVSAIGNNEIRASVVHSGTGPVTESDIRILATSGEGSYAISFNQPIDHAMHSLAEAAGVKILDHNIIYKVTDAVKEKVSDALPTIVTQRVLGEAEVGQVFEITVKKEKIKIAGCKVTNGTISRSNKVRVIRNGETVYTGTIDSLKNVKKDVTEMRKGTECGIGFSEWTGAETGDQIQCFEEKEEKRTLY